MPGYPCVDVVILSWDRIEDTLTAIDSALSQQGVDASVIIVDQGSSESTLRTLRGIADPPKVVLHEVGYNAGVPAGRNIGARLGRADVIASLDNDAAFDGSDALATAARRFQDDPRLGALAFRILIASTGQDDLLSWSYPHSRVADRPFYATRFVGAGHACRRDAFEAIGGYDESLFFMCEESDLSLRLINAGYKILYDPQIRILHRVAPERRVDWADGRYELLVRNRLYIEYKYRRRPAAVLPLAAGLVIRGLVNGLPAAAVRGCLRAVPLCRGHRRGRPDASLRLNPEAERYIAEHETVHDGNLWARLRHQVFMRLPRTHGLNGGTAATTAGPLLMSDPPSDE